MLRNRRFFGVRRRLRKSQTSLEIQGLAPHYRGRRRACGFDFKRARRARLRSEVERGEKKLSNERFIDKAPADVVDEERRKLEAYKAELEELG
jgi:valyl-tRNA synthetase